MSEISKMYSAREYCNKELLEARKIFTNCELFTLEKAELMKKTLWQMYFYAPEDMLSMIKATITEIDYRLRYLIK